MVESARTPPPHADADGGVARWRGVVVAATALGAFCVVLLACWYVAGQRIEEYRADLAAWVEGDRAVLVAAVSPVAPEAFPVGDDVDLSATDTLRAQTAACAAIDERRRDVARAVADLPVAYAGTLGVVRPALREVADQSQERRAVVERYGDQADAALAQVARDCDWSARVNARASKAQRYWAAQDEVEDPYATEGPIQCRDEAGCVPSDLDRRETYVDLAEKALDERAAVAELQAGAACRATSYGDGCIDLASSTAAEVKAWRGWYDWLATTSEEADIPGFETRSERRDTLVRDVGEKARAALAERFATAGLRYAAKEPRWIEGFFTDQAERRLVTLRALADSLPTTR